MPTDRCMLQGRQSSDDVKRTVLGPTDSFCSHTSVVAFVPMTSLKVARILDYRLPSTSDWALNNHQYSIITVSFSTS